MKIPRTRIAKYTALQLLGGKADKKLIRQVAALMIESKRVNEVELLVKDIAKELAKAGHVSAEVVSARELSAQLKKEISTFVKNQEKADYVNIDESIDSSLLGGVIIRTPEREMDVSLRGKLDRLRS